MPAEHVPRSTRKSIFMKTDKHKNGIYYLNTAKQIAGWLYNLSNIPEGKLPRYWCRSWHCKWRKNDDPSAAILDIRYVTASLPGGLDLAPNIKLPPDSSDTVFHFYCRSAADHLSAKVTIFPAPEFILESPSFCFGVSQVCFNLESATRPIAPAQQTGS